MNSTQTSLPSGLRTQLAGLRRELLRNKVLVWACLSLALAVVGYLLVWISDRVWDTPASLRHGWLLFLMAAVLGGALWIAFRWGYRHRRWDTLGRFVRRWDRRTGDRVLGAIELTGSEGQLLESPQLREAAIGQLADQLGKTDLTAAIDRTWSRRGSTIAISLALLAGVVILLAPTAGMVTAWRCFAPWKSVERYTFVQLGDLPETKLVPHGEATTISIPLKPDSPWRRSSAVMEMKHSGQRLTATLENDQYTFTLPGVITEETLNLKVGDARRRIQWIPKHRPGLEKLEAAITLPDYLKRPPLQLEITGGQLKAVTGSTVTVTGTITRALASSELRGIGSQTLEIEDRKFHIPSLAMEERPRVVEIYWEDTLGLTPKDPLRLHLQPIADQPPRIEMISSAPSPLALLANETIALGLRAEDDFGIRVLGYVWGAAGANPEEIWEKQSRELKQGTPQSISLDDDLTFSPKTLGLETGTWQVWAYAADYRPDAPPAFSSAKVVQVLTKEQHAAMIRAQFHQLQEQLESVARQEANLKQQNEALAAAATLDPAALQKQRAAEEEMAEELNQLAEQTEGLLESALKNESLDTSALEPWGDMLGAMKAVAQQGMPKAAQSLAQAQGAASGGNSGQSKAALQEAIDQQEKNLQQLADAMGQGQEIEEKLEAATFVNRLREAATAEEGLASMMKTTVLQSAGMAPNQLAPVNVKALNSLADKHDHTRKEVDYLISDLEHYHRRTQKPAYGNVHSQMIAAKTPAELLHITTRVKSNQHGRVIQGTLRWARQFHAWADALSAAKKDKKDQPQEGSGDSEGKPDMEMMLAIMRLVQREMTLRDQTRAIDRRKEHQDYAQAVESLAEEQRAIGFTVAGLIPKALGPDISMRLHAAATAIDDAAKLLAKPQTDGETIAAETEVIELLGKAAEASSQMGGNSKGMQALADLLAMMELGNSPGGNAEGGTTTLASRQAEGAAARDGREQRDVRKTTGFAAGDFPEEFREMLGQFFEQREALREEAGE